MSYTYREVTEIINTQRPFLETKYGLEKIGIINYSLSGKGVAQIDFLIHFKKPIGIYFIDMCEFIESLLNVDGEFYTEEGLESIKDENLKSGIKEKVQYV
jgi:hypothetical protein